MKRLMILFFLFCSLCYGQQIINSYQFGESCTLTAGNLYPTGNAGSECGGEGNNATGWVQFLSNPEFASVTSSGVRSTEGDYSILFTADQGGRSEYAMIAITVTENTSYDVVVDWYKSNFTNWEMWFYDWMGWQGSTGVQFNEGGSGEWHTKTQTSPLVDAGTTTAYIVIACASNSTSGAELNTDYWRVTEN